MKAVATAEKKSLKQLHSYSYNSLTCPTIGGHGAYFKNINQRVSIGRPSLGYSSTFLATIIISKTMFQKCVTNKNKGFRIFYRGKVNFYNHLSGQAAPRISNLNLNLILADSLLICPGGITKTPKLYYIHYEFIILVSSVKCLTKTYSSTSVASIYEFSKSFQYLIVSE